MNVSYRSTSTRSPAARWWRTALLAALGGLVLAAVARAAADGSEPAAAWVGAGAAALAVVGAGLYRHARGRADGENTVWRWFARAVLALAAGCLLEVLVLAGAARELGVPRPGAGLMAGMIGASFAMYQGLVRWNRHRTAVSDPGDWLNGAGAILTFMAAGSAAMALSHVGLGGLALPLLLGWLAQLGALLVLLGTALTVRVVGGMKADARIRVVAAALGAAFLAQVVVLRVSRGDTGAGDGLPAVMGSAAWAWSAVAMAVAVAARLRPRGEPPRHATTSSTAAGAAVVLSSAALVLLVDAVVAEPSLRVSAILATVACATAAIRLVLMVREMADAALSRREARTDDLTGLANRRAMVEFLDSGGRPHVSALVVIDLLRFRRLNDRLGHVWGDEVLRVIGARLLARVGSAGLVARFAGDEFVVALPDASVDGVTRLAHELLQVVREEVRVSGQEVALDASVGVAGTTLCGSGKDLWRCADAAVRAARRAGGGVVVYDEAADAQVRADRRLAEDVRAALGRPDGSGEPRFVVHYQPQLEIASGRVTGVEALVRWQHPELGLLPPVAFLDHVERQGLMDLLTESVLSQAVAEVAAWHRLGADVTLSVNLSSSCLTRPDVLETLAEHLRGQGLPPAALVVEVTETSLITDDARAIATARALADRGIGLSIDDYGTGYSSLARLDALPADELKLDRSFTARLLTEPRTAAIVAGSVDLAHRLGMRVVAEGVEDEATLGALAQLGCDISQGYLHARPMPASEMRVWLARRAHGRAAASPDAAAGAH